ncbi:MAG: hypothetical protein JXB32_17000 [Deltaproteobacteria bacterium]|nr:hypothetical protein [Deltaproteobacteria bacterium]
MTNTQPTSTIRRARHWTLRALGLVVVFVFTAAPLPGDSPGCDNPSGIDDSPALLGDPAIRTLCGEHCYADCQRLVECGRYGAGAGYSACVSECTGAGGRNCTTWSFDSLCPIGSYPDPVITLNEKDQCTTEARSAACWCDTGENCWDPSMPMPLSCTAVSLCDPR